MKPCIFDEALTNAEIACAQHIFKTAGMTVRVAVNATGDPDCAVFDIGYLSTGEHTTFPASGYHFHSKLDIYRRTRQEVQQAIMRILRSFPINADTNATNELRENSNVLVFRIAPQPQAVSEITTCDIHALKDIRPVSCWTATIQFDTVFQARFD